MRKFVGFEKGMGIGGWLTNYKRFNVLPEEWRFPLSVGDFEHFDSYITKDDLQYIASQGFDHVRVGFDQVVLEEKPRQYREVIFKILDNLVQWCEECNLNLVLNLHKAIGNYCDINFEYSLGESAELQENFIHLWVTMEERYHSKPNVAFELLNETCRISGTEWDNLATRTVNALRKINSERIIVVGGINYNGAEGMDGLGDYDDNVVFTWHTYAPFEFTHQQGVLQKNTLYYNRKMAYPSDIAPYNDFQEYVHGIKNHYQGYDKMDKTFIYDALKPALDFAKKHPNRIVWCGEFGTIRHCNITYRENYMEDIISILVEHGIAYCVWNYLSTPNDGNRFSLVDDDTRKILSPRLAKILIGDFSK